MFSGSRSLSPMDKRLAAATKRATDAAGGLASCVGRGLSNANLSRCQSFHDDASISIRNAVRVDQLGAGVDGYPEILSAMASELGAVVILLPEAPTEGDSLLLSACDLAIEVGDVARRIREALDGTSAGGCQVTSAEADAALSEIAELERKTASLRRQLEEISEAPS